jgi:hypothetical protein
MRQFQTPVYAIFCRHEILTAANEAAERGLIRKILRRNRTLRHFIRERVERVRGIARFHVPGLDEGFNLAILGDRAARLQAHELDAIRKEYGTVKLSQFHMLYDQLLYPLIFWSGTGGCGVAEGRRSRGQPASSGKSLLPW